MMTSKMPAGEAAANANHSSDRSKNEFVRIGEMAKHYDVTLRTLRFYEDKGLLAPKREGSTRFYSRRDRTRLKLILLGRKVGFSLREVKELIDLYDPSGSNSKQLRLVLEKSEKQLGRLRKQRTVLDEAIDELSAHMVRVQQLLTEKPTSRSAAAN